MKIVVFDVDDTLYDQINPFKKAIEQTFGWALNQDDLTKLYLDFRFFSDEVFEKTVSGELSLESMRIYRITEALKKNKLTSTKKQAHFFQANYQSYQKQIVLHEEMLEILKLLVNQQVTVGVLTNGPSSHQRLKIDQLGLLEFINDDYFFISEEVGLAKPDPNIFKHVATHMSKTENQLIYVGDSYENDVIGSKKAGWTCLWLNKYQKDIQSESIQPDREVTSYKEIKKELLRLLEQ